MGSEEGKLEYKLKENIFQLFKDFMLSITELEILGAEGSRLLTGFQQGLEFLRRPPINRKSKLIENIIKANETKRVKSYFEAGCIKINDSVENMSKLRTSLLGLQDHLSRAKSKLNELECLLEDVASTVQSANECLSPLWGDFDNRLELQATSDMVTSPPQEPEMTDFAVLMATIYSMVKQDYVMQEKIVTSLSLKSLSGELESYCQMWSLHPFINDETMKHAWSLIPSN